MTLVERPSRIPIPVGRPVERYELREMQKAPAPVGRAVAKVVVPHWSTTFADVINHHVWRKEALDAFESHSFTGRPGEDRWCTRCTLMLAPDWKDPKKPVPLPCGDPRIVPRFAAYRYTYDKAYVEIEPVDPNYKGAKVKDG